MAKQLVNPIERHVEKVVVGISVLVLLGAIWQYLVTSPNQLEMGGETVTPSTVDRKVAQFAEDVRNSIQRSSSDAERPERLYGDFVRSLDPFKTRKLARMLPLAAPLGVQVPIIDPPEVMEGQFKLVEVKALTKTTAITGRSTYVMLGADDIETRPSANWVSVSGIFDVKAQMDAQKLAYGATRQNVVFGPAQLQRRRARPDGTWSDDDWQDVLTWPVGSLPPVPNPQLVLEDNREVISSRDRASIEQFFDQLSTPSVQMELIRPMPPQIVIGDSWTVPVLTSRRDVLLQDDGYLFPDTLPSARLEDRYGSGDSEVDEVRELTPAQQRAETFALARQLLADAKVHRSEDEAIEAYNLANQVAGDLQASPPEKSRAKDVMRNANILGLEIRRKAIVGLRVRRGAEIQAMSDEAPKRQPSPIQQIWAHDASPESITSGAMLQYRIRPTLYNRLAGEASRFRNRVDATRLFLLGPWSDPIEVSIPIDSEFYVTSKGNGRVKVEFFRWFNGVWVKSTRFKLEIGDPIAGQSRAEAPLIDNPTLSELQTVDFEADGTIVDIDMERRYRERKSGNSRDGVRLAATQACSVVYIDAGGRLHERFVSMDKKHPGIRIAKSRLGRP